MGGYSAGLAHKVFMATEASTEREAYERLHARAVLFFGLPPDKVGLTITSVEQASVIRNKTLCSDGAEETDATYNVEGYGWVRNG